MKKLYKIVLGCTPKGRLTEQHDVYFGIGDSISALKENIINFWPVEDLHLDSWEEVIYVDNYKINIVEKNDILDSENFLFFFNLGGYIKGVFEEQHLQKIIVAKNKTEAIKKIKETNFYKNCTFNGGKSHIDNQYGIAIDEVFKIDDILEDEFKKNYSIIIEPFLNQKQNMHKIGYIKLNSI